MENGNDCHHARADKSERQSSLLLLLLLTFNAFENECPLRSNAVLGCQPPARTPLRSATGASPSSPSSPLPDAAADDDEGFKRARRTPAKVLPDAALWFPWLLLLWLGLLPFRRGISAWSIVLPVCCNCCWWLASLGALLHKML